MTNKQYKKPLRFALTLLLLILTAMVSGCDNRASGVSLEEMLALGDSGETAGRESVADKANGESVERTEDESLPEKMQRAEGDATVRVHICGAVQEPGIYELPLGSRIYDGLEAAGGFSQDADEEYYNLAAFLRDGVKIQVPERSEAETEKTKASPEERELTVAAAGDGEPADRGRGLLNINTASAQQLQELPGIGAGRAADIIAYRESCGGFRDVTQIMEVSGIKEAIFDKIKELITIE